MTLSDLLPFLCRSEDLDYFFKPIPCLFISLRRISLDISDMTDPLLLPPQKSFDYDSLSLHF